MLKVTNLRKEYDAVIAVDNISLEVKRGELFGLLGPNGAGKTTTIRNVLNIIKPDAGTITFDEKPWSPEMWNIIGYLPEERGLYKKSKIINTILYFASLKGIAEQEARPIVKYWLDRFGLKDSGARKVEELSKGNQQKIQLITAILHKPQLLILDEPFTGLDPVNQILLKDILLELRLQNIAIIFSTHQMDQVEKLCDNICLINKGKVVLDGAIRDVKKKYGTNTIHVEYDGDGEFLKKLPNVKMANIYQNYAELELHDIKKSGDLLAKVGENLDVRKYEIVEPSLQSIFVNVVGMPEREKNPELGKISPKRSFMENPEAKKAFISVLVSVVGMIIFAVVASVKKDQGWMPVGIMAGAFVLSLAKFLRVRSKAEPPKEEESR
jgi:ABC-2 type transport system ATP-binding protein